MGRGRGLTDGSNELPSFGKAGPLTLFAACTGPVFQQGHSLKGSFRSDSVFMATEATLLSFKQKRPSLPKLGTFWDCFLTIRQEKTFQRLFRDIHHPPPGPWILHNLWTRKSGESWPHSVFWGPFLLKGSFMTRPAPYWFIPRVDQKSLDWASLWKLNRPASLHCLADRIPSDTMKRAFVCSPEGKRW